ncbi:MAG: hypothetical protein IKE60_12875 [Reyranella sp.]|uniref:AAA family ATPase n=1 Tax=Reyranella sp. TaxID=1929291 RepID=UPI0025F44892|nr:AAA family ATPase [Reyranella sp.]MBR2815539.1 hypothetical protein [Reyranella sp.]
MKRILITGMSASGKSAVVRELLDRGHRAVDLDTPDWSEWVELSSADRLTPAEGKDWRWREDRVRALLFEAADRTLFVSGCAENMRRLLPLIDLVILLSAPVTTIMERFAARLRDGYGHTAGERQKVATLIATIEPLLRDIADYEIDTAQPVTATVDQLLRLCGDADQVPD